MLVDANVLIYAVDAASRQHAAAREWLTQALNGAARVALPWAALIAFLRIATNARALMHPLPPDEAASIVADWLSVQGVWIPTPGPRHLSLVQELIVRHDLRGNLISDAHLAALAIEHGLTVVSADSDFARFPEVRWLNPLQAGP